MAFKTMNNNIKTGDVLILYHQNKPKIQGICVACFEKYCTLRSLQSGFEYTIFYSNPYLKKKRIADIDFRKIYFYNYVLNGN